MEAVNPNRNNRNFALGAVCTATYLGMKSVKALSKYYGQNEIGEVAELITLYVGALAAFIIWKWWEPQLNPREQIIELIRADGLVDPDDVPAEQIDQLVEMFGEGTW